MGTMPEGLMSPGVGLIPTTPLADDGQTIEPSVSVPTATVHRFAEVAAPDPELEPQALRSSAYGFFVSPPRPLQPLVAWLERMFAHSLRLVLPRVTAPHSRMFRSTAASPLRSHPPNPTEPAAPPLSSPVRLFPFLRTR